VFCAVTRPRTQQQVERRARVIAAAMTLAAKGGYDAVQMRAVAQEADVALGTLYRYFSSKDELLLAGLEQLAEDMRSQLHEHPVRGRTLAERVSKVLAKLCDVLEAEPLLAHAVVTALSSSDPATAEHTAGVQKQLTAMIADALDGEQIDDIDGVIQVLGMVWFASMLAWVGGRTDVGSMAQDLELASRLLLR
jgi:TetR/AcrR family transcriptional regulator, cholesterol catabolism regulator